MMRLFVTLLLVIAQDCPCFGLSMRLVFKSQNALSSPAVLCRVRVAPVLKAAVSPFKQSKQKRGDPDVGPLPLTPENVELVLDEMRPYLVADGGNVSLAEINGGIRWHPTSPPL